MISGDYLAFTTMQCVGSALTKELHGGKGAALLWMANLDLPVPEAVIFTTKAWAEYRDTGELPQAVADGVHQMLEDYGDALFSVRSGAPVSMPGMMDTILNVGTDPENVTYPGAYKRFVASWLEIVHGVQKDRIEELFSLAYARADADELAFNKLVSGVISHAEGLAVPYEPSLQILECIKAVFNSWDTPRARHYRAMHGIPEDMGTACIVQRMVMGTAEGFSGSGVMFSRDPATGEPVLKGEFAQNAQGEEVVSGEITPEPIEKLKASYQAELMELAVMLEDTFGDVQDVEFTYESDKLYVLQTRMAKMSARARIITACDLAKKWNFETPEKELKYLSHRVDRGMVQATMMPVVDTKTPAMVEGLAASPGAFSGKVVFRTTPLSHIDRDCILVAPDTSPDDFPKMAAAGAILTATGGFTCHAAVVARGIGVPAIVGCGGIEFETGVKAVTIKGVSYKEGDQITIDGSTGKIWNGSMKVKKSQPPRELFETLANIAEKLYGDLPEDVYYLDCGIKDRVALSMIPGDIERAWSQVHRAHRLKAKGKEVGFVFCSPGMGEDLIVTIPAMEFKGLITDDFVEAIRGFPILGGLDAFSHKQLGDELKMPVADKVAKVVDLLDLLETKV